MNLAFLASYNGTSAQAITDACLNGELNARPTLMITNNDQAKTLEWAENKGLVTHSIHKNRDQIIADLIRQHRIGLVILSGYMALIGSETLSATKGNIVNIHPSLLPKYGGKGMYGSYIHQAVKANNETETGVTIHQVSAQYDEGKILAQKIIPLTPSMTALDIEQKVRAAEPELYIETIRKILKKEIELD